MVVASATEWMDEEFPGGQESSLTQSNKARTAEGHRAAISARSNSDRRRILLYPVFLQAGKMRRGSRMDDITCGSQEDQGGQIPTENYCFVKATICAAGRCLHAVYLYAVKAPGESRHAWDNDNCLGHDAGNGGVSADGRGWLPDREALTADPQILGSGSRDDGDRTG